MEQFIIILREWAEKSTTMLFMYYVIEVYAFITKKIAYEPTLLLFKLSYNKI